MTGQTIKHIGIFETDEGSYVYVEEHGVPMVGAMTAAPTGSATQRVEFGPFDAEAAQQMYASLCRKYPMGVPTPMMTSWGSISL